MVDEQRGYYELWTTMTEEERDAFLEDMFDRLTPFQVWVWGHHNRMAKLIMENYAHLSRTLDPVAMPEDFGPLWPVCLADIGVDEKTLQHRLSWLRNRVRQLENTA